jgi:hypothetical protein
LLTSVIDKDQPSAAKPAHASTKDQLNACAAALSPILLPGQLPMQLHCCHCWLTRPGE